MKRLSAVTPFSLLLLLAPVLITTGCPKRGQDSVPTGGEEGGRIVRQETPAIDGGVTGQIEVKVYAGSDRVGRDAKIFVYKPDDHAYAVAEMGDGVPEKLPVGNYDVEVVFADNFGMERTRWKKGLKVSAGKILKEKVSFEFGTLTVQVGGAGTSYTAGDISVAAFPAGEKRRAVAEAWADSSLTLLEGTYDVLLELARGGGSGEVWEKGVVIEAGKSTAIEVNFSGGSLVVRLQGGKPLPGVQVEVYPVGRTTGAVALGSPGSEFNVPPGSYDIRVLVGQGSGKYEHWEPGVKVKMGKTNRADILLPVGTVKVNAFTSGAGQIPGSDFTVYVYPSGNTSNSILYMNGAETIALDPGRYDLRVEYTNSHDKPSVWVKGVSAREGKHETLSAEFKTTSITTVVKVANKVIPGNDVLVYYYPEGSSEYAAQTIAGVPAILKEGNYKIKVEYIGGAVHFEEWAGTHSAKSGKSLTVEYKLLAGWVKFVSKSGELKRLRPAETVAHPEIGDEFLLPEGNYALFTEEGGMIPITVLREGREEI